MPALRLTVVILALVNLTGENECSPHRPSFRIAAVLTIRGAASCAATNWYEAIALRRRLSLESTGLLGICSDVKFPLNVRFSRKKRAPSNQVWLNRAVIVRADDRGAS